MIVVQASRLRACSVGVPPAAPQIAVAAETAALQSGSRDGRTTTACGVGVPPAVCYQSSANDGLTTMKTVMKSEACSVGVSPAVVEGVPARRQAMPRGAADKSLASQQEQRAGGTPTPQTPAGGTPTPQGGKRVPEFSFIDPRDTPFVEPKSRGLLPHLYKECGTYFVTFRLRDAVVPKDERTKKVGIAAKRSAGETPTLHDKTR